ncbi:MAG: ABC transporter permease [Verrucomicrobia bacterium]|nr:ABC transporter permease [Verrucomicrobiota bacterium]
MNDSIRHTWTIAKRELVGYFASPVAYVFIVIFLLLNGFFTFMLGGFFERGEASLASFFIWHPWLYLFLVPAAGMRLWSEERRQGTMELLLTMPITAWQAIVGKFLASWLFLILALDMGAIWAGYFGSVLLAGAYLAVTCMTSAMTRNQVISFILSVVICFFLILAGWEPVTNLLVRWAPDWLVSTVASFSVMPHFASFQRGVIDFRDVLFFASLAVFPLFVTGVILRNLRAG